MRGRLLDLEISMIALIAKQYSCLQLSQKAKYNTTFLYGSKNKNAEA